MAIRVQAWAAGLLISMASSFPVISQADVTLVVSSGKAKTFRLVPVGGALVPGAIREAPIGPPNPAPGEITVSLEPSGGSHGWVKVHVFERSAKPIRFEIAVFSAGRPADKQTMCGRLELDAWTTVPIGTKQVVLSQFADLSGACP